MKVKAIEPYQSRGGDDRWKVIFEESQYPLILIESPDIAPGDTIPKSKLHLIQKEGYAYFVPKETHEATSPRSESIETQVVWKGLVDIFVAGKLDELATSTNYLAIGIRAYAERRLVQDKCLPEDQ